MSESGSDRLTQEQIEFAAQASEKLDVDLQNMDEALISRLAKARRAALEESYRPVPNLWNAWLPAGAFAAIALVITVLVNTGTPGLPNYESELQASAATEMELLEDLEFAAWILEEGLNAG